MYCLSLYSYKNIKLYDLFYEQNKFKEIKSCQIIVSTETEKLLNYKQGQP